MNNQTTELILEAKRIFPKLTELEERLASEPETIIAQAFPPTEPTLRARSIIWPGLKTNALSELDTAVYSARRHVLEFARLALQKILAEDEDAQLEPEEALGLEAIVLAEGRPSILVQNGRFATPPPNWRILDEVRNSVEKACKSVGRINIDHPSLDFVGTGFLVADNVIMTNRHVAELFCQSRGNGFWTFEQEYQPCVDYFHEWGTPNRARFGITELIAVHDDKRIDLALFRVARESLDDAIMPTPLAVATEYDAAAKGRKVYTIGYPYSRDGDPEILRRIFGDIYGYKRLQPGEILDVHGEEHLLLHDCSTLGGNSGSCVIDLETGQVIGLHFGGRYRKANKAIALWLLKEDPLLRFAGVNFE